MELFAPYDAEKAARLCRKRWGWDDKTTEFLCTVSYHNRPIDRILYAVGPGCSPSCVDCWRKTFDQYLKHRLIPVLFGRTASLGEMEEVYRRTGSSIERVQASFDQWYFNRLIECPNCRVASDGDASCRISECPHCDASFCTLCFTVVSSDPHECSMEAWIAEEKKKEGYYAAEGRYVEGADVDLDGDEEYYQTCRVFRCPGCGCLAQKVDGCTSVTCLVCHTSFSASMVDDA